MPIKYARDLLSKLRTSKHFCKNCSYKMVSFARRGLGIQTYRAQSIVILSNLLFQVILKYLLYYISCVPISLLKDYPELLIGAIG